ncbi:unnamed protein product [Spirodela intermedia]|uniref:Uncharacterized protein n=2 Tax=Spirodela intermedia TaxID=51605 RepID=A0A7I8J8T5_SPIIN|nr:unnamed protein product [Spirodela intermedia]CAA6665833.1 unnamed protein product [Spirodela intermedia]CAB1184541.1 unnamed protein product [Spirodela intermedia]
MELAWVPHLRFVFSVRSRCVLMRARWHP